MILNTGSRSDIPAFYSEWFMNRIRAGFVYARNPFYYHQVISYKLDPKVVDVLVFCSKNPGPMLKYLDELSRFRMFWFVTITPYGKDVEPQVPDKKEVLADFRRIADKLGAEHLSWRYDPIFLSEKYDLDFHLRAFKEMAEYLRGYTSQVVISFIDLYEKTKRNFPEVKEVDIADQIRIVQHFSRIAENNGMVLRLCHEDAELGKYGADVTGCLSKEVLEQAIGEKLKVKKKLDTRQGCNCLLGNDIGAYNSCGHLCRYCYANYDAHIVRWNMARHDPHSPLLIGNIEEGDVIKESQQFSFIDEQLSLF